MDRKHFPFTVIISSISNAGINTSSETFHYLGGIEGAAFYGMLKTYILNHIQLFWGAHSTLTFEVTSTVLSAIMIAIYIMTSRLTLIQSKDMFSHFRQLSYDVHYSIGEN